MYYLLGGSKDHRDMSRKTKKRIKLNEISKQKQTWIKLDTMTNQNIDIFFFRAKIPMNIEKKKHTENIFVFRL